MVGAYLSDYSLFESVFDIFQEEKKKGELQTLPKDFYVKSSEYVAELERSANISDESAKKLGNFNKLVSGLKERRKQKLLIYLAYNKPLPEKIPFEEEQLYIKLKNTMNDQGPNEQKLSKLKINSDIPEIITPNGSRLGPFNQNQIIEVDNSVDIEFLVNNNVGEIIQA